MTTRNTIKLALWCLALIVGIRVGGEVFWKSPLATSSDPGDTSEPDPRAWARAGDAKVPTPTSASPAQIRRELDDSTTKETNHEALTNGASSAPRKSIDLPLSTFTKSQLFAIAERELRIINPRWKKSELIAVLEANRNLNGEH